MENSNRSHYGSMEHTSIEDDNSSHLQKAEDVISVGAQKGLTILSCALFIVATMAGSGILALPKAIGEAGWMGIGVLVLCCCMSLYCGIVLGKCWIICRQNNPKLLGHVRDPYPAIGQEACGKWGRRLVEFCVLVTLFGVCIVFLLLSSHQISSLLNTNIGSLTPKNEFRVFILICGGMLLPFTWLASPKEIWQFALGASMCTLVVCVFIIVRMAWYLGDFGIAEASVGQDTTTESFFKAFGTIAFSFGGATVFPTFQTDMKRPRNFSYAACLAFLAVLIMYIPVVTLPYLAFGSALDDNILKTLKDARGNGRFLVTTSEALITFHLLFTFVITVNPISQQLEKYCNIEHAFGLKRILMRSLVVLTIIAFAEAIPKFGTILSFIGGSTITMTAFVLPCLFYLRLKRDVALHVIVLHVEIVMVALVSGATATYYAVVNFSDPFES